MLGILPQSEITHSVLMPVYFIYHILTNSNFMVNSIYSPLDMLTNLRVRVFGHVNLNGIWKQIRSTAGAPLVRWFLLLP